LPVCQVEELEKVQLAISSATMAAKVEWDNKQI